MAAVHGIDDVTATQAGEAEDVLQHNTITLEWSALSTEQYEAEAKKTVSRLKRFTRAYTKELRENTLPMLRDARRRFKAGETVCGYTKLHDFYYEFVGVNPSTVRQWEYRERLERQPEANNSASSFASSVFFKDMIDSLDVEGIEDNPVPADPDPVSDPNTEPTNEYSETEAARKYRAWEEEFNRRWNNNPYNPFATRKPTVSEDAIKMFKDFAPTALRRELAKRFHPDAEGGSHNCMQTANEVVDVLLPHVFMLLGEVTEQ